MKTMGHKEVVAAIGIWLLPQRQNGSAIFGYRHMEIDFEESEGPNDVSLDLTMTGPFVGLGIDF